MRSGVGCGYKLSRVLNCLRHGCSIVCYLMQHEVGVRNLEILNSTTDARGRKLEVVKVHCPPPLFRTYREAEGVDVSPPTARL